MLVLAVVGDLQNQAEGASLADHLDLGAGLLPQPGTVAGAMIRPSRSC